VDPTAGADLRLVSTAANRQPAVAVYVRPPGERVHRAAGLHVLRVDGETIAEITAFDAAALRPFAVPARC
jgi:RNA polymerase sigma-70 factor (ECF subfamily)